MSNSYGFDGKIPANAVAGKYDSLNGEWMGIFYFSIEEAQEAEKQIDNEAHSIKAVNNSEWVGAT